MKKFFISICLAIGINTGFFFATSTLGNALQRAVPSRRTVVEIVPLPDKKEVHKQIPRVTPKAVTPAPQTKREVTTRPTAHPHTGKSTSQSEKGKKPSELISKIDLKIDQFLPEVEGDLLFPHHAAPEVSPATPPEEKKEWKIDEVDSLPVRINYVQPEYPHWALEQELEGSVSLIFLIDETGKVRDIRITRSSQVPAFDASAIAAVKQWRYKPAKKGHKAVAVWQPCVIKFQFTEQKEER